jgi:hypothetical protein
MIIFAYKLLALLLLQAVPAESAIVLENTTDQQLTVFIQRIGQETYEQPPIQIPGKSRRELERDRYPPGVYAFAARFPGRNFVYSGWKDFRNHKMSYQLTQTDDTAAADTANGDVAAADTANGDVAAADTANGDIAADDPRKAPNAFRMDYSISRRQGNEWMEDYSTRVLWGMRFINATDEPIEVWVQRTGTMRFDTPSFKIGADSRCDLKGYPAGDKYKFAVRLRDGTTLFSDWIENKRFGGFQIFLEKKGVRFDSRAYYTFCPWQGDYRFIYYQQH